MGPCTGTYIRLLAAGWLATSILAALEQYGQVTLGGLPVPGVTVTATQGEKKFIAVTDGGGGYSFADMTDGRWMMEVQMTGFATVKQEVTITRNAHAVKWELKLLPLEQIQAVPERAAAVTPPQGKQQETAAPQEDLAQSAAEGLLINGSVNNGAASTFAQAAAFGNNRNGANGLYTGGIGLIFENSALDAKPFSLTGQNTPKPAYNDLTGVLTLGGPFRIPHLLEKGPSFFVGYQWTRNRHSTTQSALMPNAAQRAGEGIPQDRINPQALALLKLYPLPNFSGSSRYNYQIATVNPTHQDALQARFNQTIDNKNQLYGRFGFESTRTDNPNVFGFLDTSDTLAVTTSVNWSHRFSQRVFLNLGYQFSRLATHMTPYFENRENVSGNAGIQGNNQEPVNWGPPSLTFASGIAGLSDGLPAFNRNQTSAESFAILWNRGVHNIMFGGDFRRQEFNYLSQQNPRGSFTFTGAAAGSDFADFLLGIPDTSSIAFGNADKYFRESVYDAYLADDWRVGPQLTLNAGVRWEYGAPIAELYNRLVNLDIAPGFGAVAPVLASNPTGAVTGQRYPDSLLRPDRSGFEPRIGIAWRPISGSSLVIRAGYGAYYNTSVYQTIATQLAQQPPLSKTLSLQNSAADPLTLANGFNASPLTTANTFAIDPNFRVGYAQNWQLAVQRDLPGSLQMTAAYLGIKGTRGLQEFLPNTYPIGAANPCPACAAGYVYLTSNGNSTREAGEIQLRRRLHNGFTGIAQYTFSKSIDDVAALGGQGALLGMPVTQNPTAQNPSGSSSGAAAVTGTAQGSTGTGAAGAGNATIAQNWLNLSAERGLSNFDQRHLLSLQLQYTTGMGLAGGTLLSGWKGALLNEWTFATELTAGSGLPLSPVYLAAVPGTGVTGTIRPEYTGAPLYAAPGGLSLNPAAYTTPLPGEWGNAGRNSITGPAQLTFDASIGRTFRLKDRFNLDLRIDSINALNHVTFTSWNTTINNAQFGLPVAANGMRSLQTMLRLRF